MPYKLKYGGLPLQPTTAIGLDWSSVTEPPPRWNIQEYVEQVYLPRVGLKQSPWKLLMFEQAGRDGLFLSRLDAWRDHRAMERLRTVQRGIEYDANLNGWWIERGSTAHSLANILGFKLYDPNVAKKQQ